MSYQQEKYGQQPYGQQPMPVMQMNAGGGGNRNAAGMPVNSDGQRAWSHGLCDCCGAGCGSCLSAWCCPCFKYGQNKARFNSLQEHGRPDPDHGGCGWGGPCFGHCVLSHCGLQWILMMITRGDIRARYSIEGGGCGDCCTSCFCQPCNLVREQHEIQLEEQSLGM